MLPHLSSADVGGVYKVTPEDFEVVERPKPPREGEGEEAGAEPTHTWFWVRKRDFTTQEAARRVARALDVAPRDANWAGMKDRWAVTRQWISVPGVDHAWKDVELEGIAIEDAQRKPHGLKPGQLAGNHFTVVVREVDPSAHEGLRARAAELRATGLPNYFGPQRFGRDNLGRAERWIVQGERAPRDRFQRRMLVSALQSEGFNRVLAERVREGTMARALLGDRLRKEDTGGLFVCDDVDAAQPRVERWEISPTGPMFGRKMPKVSGAVETLESSVREALGLDDDALRRMGKLGRGTRRALRVQPEGLEVEPLADDAVRLSFALPAGSYATELLRALFGDGIREAPRS